MSLAPGRKYDMERLLALRDRYPRYSEKWNNACLRIDDLITEGKDRKLHSLRERLIGASRANDQSEIEKIQKQIAVHVKRTDPWRYYRGWIKKGN